MEPKLVIFLAFTARVLAGPISSRVVIDPSSCASRCNANTKFQYAAGSTYEYTYETGTRTTMSGAAEDHAGLKLTADVSIEALTSCEMLMTLSNVRVMRSDPDSPRHMTGGDNYGYLAKGLEAHPLRFAYQDGVVEQVCPEVEEATWALNLKRAMLSAFQNSMTDLQRDQRVKETDVTGECYTDYRVTQRGWKTSTIKKTKDLTRCQDRHGQRTSFHSLQYKIPHAIQSLSLMKSTHECSQIITSEGLLKKSSCSETHVFRPFSKDNNGATTEASHTLEYKRTRPFVRNSQGAIASRKPLLFDHTYGLRDEDAKKRDASVKLQEICRTTENGIRPEVPEMFSELVYILKNANYRSLSDIYRQLQRGQLCRNNAKMGRKFFIDAIPMIGSVDSLKMMTELISKEAVSQDQADMWLTSLAFVQHPSADMLIQVEPLMRSYDSKKSKLLVAAMVNNFCQKTPDCGSVSIVDRIITSLSADIGRDCIVNDNNHDDILVSLRAIGNLGHVERLTFYLEPCFTRDENPMEIRVAALDAFRRIPCGADRNNAMQLYLNSDADAEIRIAGYLVAMQCPVPFILEQVQRTLGLEKANQVGSFVWSHLMNLQETSSVLKQDIRKILRDENLAKEFDLDKRKFSRNYEGSFFWEKFNAGAMVESNMIWSSKSFLPRSASLNLTVDLFGNSINLFEVGGRMEGLESILESVLAPGSKNKEAGNAGYESTRAVKKEKLDRMKQKYGQVKDDLHASMFVRIFGNELRYMHFDSANWPLSKEKFNFRNFLQKMSKDYDYSFTNSMMFMDTSIIVPTCSGLPLNLTVQGAATVHVEASGKVDLRKAIASPRNMLIEGQIKPSGALEITGMMTVDAFVTKTGLKMVTSVHSSSSVKGRIELSNGQIFNMELDMPQDKMEIFNVKSRFFIVHDKVEKEQTMIQDNRKERKACWGDRLSQLTGVELCGEVGFPNASMMVDTPHFPFTGPVNFGLTLKKKDTHSGYRMVVKSIATKDRLFGQVGFDTPGSKVKRAISLDVGVNFKDKSMELGLVSPWKEATFKSSLVDTKNHKQMKGVLLLDKKDEYHVDTEIKISKKGSKVTYLPTVEVRMPKGSNTVLKGSITRDGVQEADIDLDLDLFMIFEKAFNVKAGYSNSKFKRSLSGSVALSAKEQYSFLAQFLTSKSKSSSRYQPVLIVTLPKKELINLKGSMEQRSNKAYKMDITLQSEMVLTKPMRLKADIMKTDSNSKRKKLRYKGTTQFTSEFGTVKLTSFIDKKKASSVSTQFVLDYQFSLKKKNRVTLSSKFQDRSGKAGTLKYMLNANFDVKKHQDYNMFVDLGFIKTSRHAEVEMKLRHGGNVKDLDNKREELNLLAFVDHKVPPTGLTANIDYSIAVKYPVRNVDFHAKGHHSHDKKNLASSLAVMYGKKKSMTTSFKLRDRSRKFLNMEGTFALSYPGQDIFLMSNLTQKSKTKYLHSINLNLPNGKKSTVVTSYEPAGDRTYRVSSEAVLHGYEPVLFDGAVKLDPRDLMLSAKVNRKNDIYGISAESTISTGRDSNGAWKLEVLYPNRDMKVFVRGGRTGHKYRAEMDTLWWTSGNGERPRIHALASFENKHGANKSIDGVFEITTPFSNYEKIAAEVEYNNLKKAVSAKGSAVWGRKKLSVSASLDKPFKIENIGFIVTATTPFRGFETMELSASNKYDNSLLTSFKCVAGPHNVQLKLNYEYAVNIIRRAIETNFEIRSSFRGYKIIGLSFSHHDNGHTYDSSAKYNDNGDIYRADLDAKVIINTQINFNGDSTLVLVSPNHRITSKLSHEHRPYAVVTTFSSDWGRGKKVVIELNADYQKVLNTKVNGGIMIQTPWEPVTDMNVNLMYEGGNRHFKINTYAKNNRRTLIQIDSNYMRNSRKAEFDVIFTGTLLKDDISSKFNVMEYNGNPTRGHFEVQWAPTKKISTDINIDISPEPDTIDITFRLTTPFEDAKNIVFKYSNKKSNEVWICNVVLDYGLSEYFTFLNKHSVDNKMNRLTFKSSHPKFQHFEYGYQVTGSAKAMHILADVKVKPYVKKLNYELNWNTSKGAFTGTFRGDTAHKDVEYFKITASHLSNGNNRDGLIEIEYHPKKVITMATNYYIIDNKDFKLEATLKTPYPKYDRFGINASFKGTQSAMEARAAVTTPFKKYEDISVNFNHALAEPAIVQTHLDVTYSPGQTLETDIYLNRENGLDGSIVFRSPFKGFRTIRTTLDHQGDSWKDFTCKTEIQYDNKRIEGNVDFHHGRTTTTGSVDIKTPYRGFETIKAEINKEGKLSDFKLKGSMIYGVKVHEAALQYALKGQRFGIAGVLKTPYCQEIRTKFDKDGNMNDITSRGELSYGSNYKVMSDIRYKHNVSDIALRSEIDYVWAGKGASAGATVVKQGSKNNFNVELGGKYNNKVMHVASDFRRGKTSKGSLKVQTPFKQYTNLGFEFDYTGGEKRSVANSKFNIRDDREYQTRVESLVQGSKRFETSVEVTTPHEGHESYKLDYRHSFRKEKFVAEAQVYQGMRKTYSGDLEVDYTVPARGSLTVRTPHDGYRRIQATGEYEKRHSLHKMLLNADVGKHGVISAESSFDTSGNPYTGNIAIKTPFKRYDNITVYFKHSGTLRKFRSTATLKVPNMEPVSTEARWDYVSPSSADGLISVNSGLTNMEAIKVGLRNSRRGDTYNSHLEVGWQKDQIVSVFGSHRLEKRFRGVELSNSLSITTPYRQLATLNMNLDHLHNSEKVAEKVTVDYNGKSYLDADMDYMYNQRHDASVHIRQPRPMAMTVGGKFHRDQFNTDVYINWNQNELASNIKFHTAYNDRSSGSNVDSDFKLKMIHPVRTMGIEGAVKRLPDTMVNKALITWDEKKGNTLAYDVQWNDRNRRYRQKRDGSFKIVLPVRSVKVSGSYVNSTSTKMLDASFLWDADKDPSKQVGIKLDSDYNGETVKRTVLVHLPSIKKDYKMESTLTRNQGNLLLDGTTTFSYSPDPRKALTLTTKLENLGSYSYKNYSVTVGVNHPSTYTNLLLNTHSGRSSTSCSGGLVFSYETRNNEKKYFVLRGELDSRNNQLDIQASSPLKHVLLTGRMDKDKPYHISLVNRYDQDKVVSSDITVDTEMRTLDVAFAYDSGNPGNSIHISAGYVNDSAISAEIYRKADMTPISESLIAVRLNTSHILHTRITWRPSAIPEFQQFIKSKVQIYSYEMNDATNEISQAMGQEVKSKYGKIATEIYTELEPVLQLLETELGTAKANLDIIRRELRRAYRRNDLYIQDMTSPITESFNQAFGGFGDFVDKFERFYVMIEQTMTNFLQKVKYYPISQKYMEFVDKLIENIKQGRKTSEYQMRFVAQRMDKFSRDMYRIYLTQTRALQRHLKAFIQSIIGHPQMQGLMVHYNNMRTKMAGLPEVDYKRYGQLMDELIQKSLEPVELKDSYNQVKATTQKILKKHINNLKNLKDFQKASVMANEIYQQLVWAYRYWDLDTNMRLTMVRLYKASRDLIFDELNKLKDALVDLDKSRVIVYDPINGELQFELYLPIPLKSLAETPDFNIKRYVQKLKTFCDRFIPGSNYSVWDTYYKFVPSLDSKTWLPPYSATAAVIGNQHFITFDNNHFDFAGRCSYVLTRDMVNDNFTVVLNYDNNVRNPRKKSILVMLPGINIEAASDYKVTINDRPVELPFSQGQVEAMRQGSRIIIMDGSGLTVTVDPELDMYTLELSGWYHGRTAGLLGTFDNEKANDMTTSAGKMVDDVTAFATSWEIGRKSCRSANKAIVIESPHPECVAFFEAQGSMFRPCFSVVSPREFLHSCGGLVQKGSSQTEARCLTSGQYRLQCRASGVYLPMPKDCVKCNLGTSMEPIGRGETVQLSVANERAPLPSSADVILVLEERVTKQWTPNTLGDIVTGIDSSLRSAGIKHNRYAMIGYGGPGRLVDAHSHTFDGDLFSNAKGFLKGVENVLYSEGSKTGDGLAAVRMATRYPFRAGVSKVIIFIPASECEANTAHVDLDGLLKTNGFIMHVLRNKALYIGDNRPVKNVQIFGMDKRQVITTDQSPVRNRELFEQLVQPTDACASLALATNGSVFDTTYHMEGSSRQKRNFLKTFAASVTNNAAPPMCQSCTCEVNEDGMGRTVCKPCDQASFLWNYVPDWWVTNRTPVFKDSFSTDLKDYLTSRRRVLPA